jgi:methionyl-tRNA formyltransferase
VRLVFLGTSSFACPALATLFEHNEVQLVVTQPDRPADRHARLRPPPVKELAQQIGVPVFQPERINTQEALTKLRAARPDVIIVAAYGQLLKPQVFTIPPHGAINIHASLLPAYRGAAPVNWAILQGQSVTGITTFRIERGMDTGDILLQRRLSIDPNETAGELEARLAKLGAEAILATLYALSEGSLTPIPQPENDVSHAPRLSREHGHVDWTRSALSVHNLVRGTNPWPGAWTQLSGERIKIHRTAQTGVESGAITPGAIALQQTNRLLVGCGDQLLEILTIQRQGRPQTSGPAFLNGLRGEEGRFD